MIEWCKCGRVTDVPLVSDSRAEAQRELIEIVERQVA